MKTIAIVNQKGGVGKTTTAYNVGVMLHNVGNKVILLDFDPSANLSKYVGHIPDHKPMITDFLIAKVAYMPHPDKEGVIRHAESGVDYIPSSIGLAKAEYNLIQAMFRERALSDVLADIIPAGAYDYCIIDCGPSMGILMTNALVAATEVLIPVQCEEFAMDGLDDMLELISIVQQQIKPELRIAGILPTMASNNAVSKKIIERLKENYGGAVMDTIISRGVEAARSTTQRTPLKASGRIGNQYQRATLELLDKIKVESVHLSH